MLTINAVYFFMKNISIRNKLIILISLPLLGFICLGLFLANENYKSYKNLKQIEQIITLSTKISSLVHEIQLERGLATGFLGTKGLKFKDSLEKQKISTNKIKNDLLIYFNSFHQNNYNNEFIKTLNRAIDKLSILDEKRERINSFLISNSEVLSYYTNINKLFLDAITSIDKKIIPATLSSKLISYEQFSRAKDTVGIERAIGATVLGNGFFEDGMRIKFHSLINNQKIYLENFNKYSNIKTIRFLEKIMLDKKIAESNRIREIIINSYEKHKTISKLQKLIGYGGMIYNYNNYLLHRNPIFKETFLKQYNSAIETIIYYKSIGVLKDEEYKLLEDIQLVFSKYLINVNRIDDKVVINDQAAIEALNKLSSSFFTDSAEYWFEVTTHKINILKKVDDYLLAKLKEDIRETINEFKTLIYSFIVFCLFVFLIVFIFGHIISKNINDLFEKLISKMEIFFKYLKKEVTDVSLLENDLKFELGTKVTDLNTKIMESKDIMSYVNKSLDEALSLSNLYEYAIEKSNIIIRVNLDYNITYVNNSFCEISEYTKEELIGKPYSILIHPDVRNENLEERYKTVASGSIWKGTLQNISKTGKIFHSISTIVPIKNKGKIVEYMGIRQDITEIINLHQELEDAQREVIYKMGEIGETRSNETGNHVKRVAEYSKLLALKVGINEKDAETLKHASPMHDIGKVGIPDSILNKPGKLTDEEFEIMKEHSVIGYKMLKKSTRPILATSAIVSHEHHEKYDGTGYPRGLQGEEIHIYGRITAICDVFDALGSSRVYKKAWDLNEILDYLKEEKGKHFDPHLIDLFLDNLDEFLVIRNKYHE